MVFGQLHSGLVGRRWLLLKWENLLWPCSLAAAEIVPDRGVPEVEDLRMIPPMVAPHLSATQARQMIVPGKLSGSLQ